MTPIENLKDYGIPPRYTLMPLSLQSTCLYFMYSQQKGIVARGVFTYRSLAFTVQGRTVVATGRDLLVNWPRGGRNFLLHPGCPFCCCRALYSLSIVAHFCAEDYAGIN